MHLNILTAHGAFSIIVLRLDFFPLDTVKCCLKYHALICQMGEFCIAVLSVLYLYLTSHRLP